MIKNELRRNDGPFASQRTVDRIRSLCRAEKSDELLALYPESLRNPANRLLAKICRKPSALRIRMIRLIFLLVRK